MATTMKNLVKYIEEKLKINKDYKSVELDWLNADKFFLIRFTKNDLNNPIIIHVSKVKHIEQKDKCKYVVYFEDPTDEGYIRDEFILDEKENVLYTQLEDYHLIILIHPDDYERLRKLYDSIDYLDEGTKYSKYDILKQLDIDDSFVKDAHNVIFEYNDGHIKSRGSIIKRRNKVKKELEQLLK